MNGDDFVDWIAYDPYGARGFKRLVIWLMNRRLMRGRWPGIYRWAARARGFEHPDDCDTPRAMSWFAAAGALIVLGLLLLGCGLPVSDASPRRAEPETITTTTTFAPQTTAAAPLRVETVADAATTTATALRVSPPTTTAPPFDPVAYCNSLPYAYQDMGPAMECFRVAALADGWPQESVDRVFPFVFDLIIKESGGCPFTRRGDTYRTGTCEHSHYGTGEDTGFGQATYSLYGPNGIVCKLNGYCSSASILASPWDSMMASVVIPIRVEGRFPWCDYLVNGHKPTWHNCSLIPEDWRPLP